MKYLCACFFLLISMKACTGASSSAERCSQNGEVCITMVIEDPFQVGGPNMVTVSVTSTLDIEGLPIYLEASPPAILFEDLQNWTDRVISWDVDIKANQPQSFTRKFFFEKDGYYQLIAMAKTINYIAEYSLVLHQENGTVEFFYANTPIPRTPGPLPTIGPELLQTLHAVPSPTRYPTLVPKPTSISTPTP